MARASGLPGAADPVKTLKLIAEITVAFFATQSLSAQSFQNLKFEQANPVIDQGGQFYPNDVTAASALPHWTVYLGSVAQTDVLQNPDTTGQATVDIYGPDYPSTGGGFGTIDGNYSIVLQAGNYPYSPEQVDASIAQTGTVPITAESLQFKTLGAMIPNDVVTFDGINLSPVFLGTGVSSIGVNYTLYGVDISPYSGQTGQLEFSSTVSELGLVSFPLDDIAFSPNAVPEPNIFALSAMGGLFFGARQWFARRG